MSIGVLHHPPMEVQRKYPPGIEGLWSPRPMPPTTKDAHNPHRTYKWKFVDAKAFIERGILKLLEAEDFRQVNFAAISYTWSPNMLEWRKWIMSIGEYSQEEKKIRVPAGRPASEAMARFHLFFTAVCFLVLVRRKRYFWMDVLSVDQDANDEKAFFVPRMGSLFSSAAETHAYPCGSSFVKLYSKELHYPIWETRAWTLQEYFKSKNVVYCYCFIGDMMEDINSLMESNMQSRITEVDSPILARYTSSSTNIHVLETANKEGPTMTCYHEDDNLFGPGLLGRSHDKTDLWGGPDMVNAIRRKTLGKPVYNMKHHGSKDQIQWMSLVFLGGRMSTVPQDMLYSVLGLLEMEDFPVRYDIGFEETKAMFFESMKPDVLSMVIGSDWGCILDSTMNKDTALPRVVGSEPTIGLNKVEITNFSKYTKGVGTEVISRRECFRMWKDPERRQNKNIGVIRATLGSQTSKLLVMYCASVSDNSEYADLPVSDIPEHDIRPVILSGVSRLSDEEYHDADIKYDKIVNLVEIAVCHHYGLLVDPRDQKYMLHTALLALECEEIAPGILKNKGTVLVLDASAFSGEAMNNLIT